MTPATELPPGAFGLLRWRPLLAASLAAVLTACGSSDPNATLLSEELLDTGVQQQAAVTWTLPSARWPRQGLSGRTPRESTCSSTAQTPARETRFTS